MCTSEFGHKSRQGSACMLPSRGRQHTTCCPGHFVFHVQQMPIGPGRDGPREGTRQDRSGADTCHCPTMASYLRARRSFDRWARARPAKVHGRYMCLLDTAYRHRDLATFAAETTLILAVNAKVVFCTIDARGRYIDTSPLTAGAP